MSNTKKVKHSTADLAARPAISRMGPLPTEAAAEKLVKVMLLTGKDKTLAWTVEGFGQQWFAVGTKGAK